MPMTGTSSEVLPRLCRSSGLLEILDRHRLDRICQGEAEDFRIKGELALERALDFLRDAEAVLLALQGKGGDRQPLLAERIDDGLGLVGRNDLVRQCLEQDHGTG